MITWLTCAKTQIWICEKGYSFLVLFLNNKIYFLFSYVCLWLALCGWSCEHYDRDRDFSSYSIKRHHYLCFYSSFVFTYLYPPRSPDLHCTTFRNCEQKLNMPAFINHSNMFSLGAKSAYHSSRLLSRLANYFHCASSLSLYALVF